MPAPLQTACLVAIVVACFLTSLGAPGLWEKDEGRYTLASREMRRSGDLVIPTLRGINRLNKPPLIYWLMAGSQSVFGDSEFSSRLPAATAGILTALLAYFLARRLAGEAAGWFAALVYSTSVIGAGMSRLAHPESWLTLSLTASLLCFFHAYRDEFQDKRHLVLAWLLAGMGFLAKGPHGVLLPLLVFTVYLWLRKDLKALRGAMILRGILLAIVPVAAWGLMVYLRQGREVLDEWFLESVGRFSGKKDYHTEPVWFFVPVVLGGFLPWTPWLPAVWERFRRAGGTVTGGRFLFAWALTAFLFYSASPNKAASYMQSVMPPLSVATGIGLAGLRPGRLLRFTGVFLGVAAAGGLVTMALVRHRELAYFPGEAWITVGTVCAGLAAVAALAILGRARAAAVVASAAAVTSVLVAAYVLMPAASPLNSVKEAALAARDTWQEGDLLVNFGSKRFGLSYYTDLPVHRGPGFEPEDAAGLWDGPKRIVAFGKKSYREALKASGHTVHEIWSHPERKYCIYSNRPPNK